MSYETQLQVTVLAPLLLQLVGLIFVVVGDPHIRRENRADLVIIIALLFSLIAQNFGVYLLATRYPSDIARTLLGIWGYAVRPVVLVLFIRIMDRPHRPVIPWVLAGVNVLAYLTALFSNVTFAIVDNVFLRGPLGYLCHVISAVMLIWLLVLTFKGIGEKPARETVIPLMATLMIMVAVEADSLTGESMAVSFLTIAMVSACMFFYIWLHLMFVREHEDALLAEQRIRIMISQIQPHFMYNTLSTIQALCRYDPEKAFEVTGKFGAYLRQNIDSLNQAELVPFEKELEHTQVYADIEQVRFPFIQVDYRIRDLDFRLPALTVQPLVENAFRHGVRGVANGQITVISERTEDYHRIEVRDNGAGFDPAVSVENADSSHIGIRNVRERIERMTGGSLEIDSVKGEGTTILIRIPLRKDDHEHPVRG